MTVAEAIGRVNVIRPNQYTTDQMREWLSELDAKAFNEIIKTHEGEAPEEFVPYTAVSDELLIPFPYAGDVYTFWLISQIDLFNAETARYNQSITLFNNAYTTYQNWYNRENIPKSMGRIRF